jgi:hypothetical protein
LVDRSNCRRDDATGGPIVNALVGNEALEYQV